MRALFIDQRTNRKPLYIGLSLLPILLLAWLVHAAEWTWTDFRIFLSDQVKQIQEHGDRVETVVEQVPVPIADASMDASSASPSAENVGMPAEEAADQQVEVFIRQWASDWSSKNIDAYFSAYSDQFQPDGKKSLQEWKVERRQRILPKKNISVDIADIAVISTNETGLTVSFSQTYVADNFRSTSSKILVLSHQDSGWKIVKEYTP